MAESYGPFTTGAGASFGEQFWRDLWGNLFYPGVIKGATVGGGASSDLAVSTATGMNVTLGTGIAFVYGFFYENDAALTKAIAAADTTLDRIDVVVVTMNYAAMTVTSAIVQGTLSSSPVVPALTQNNTTWQVPLAQVYVHHGESSVAGGDITDVRQYTGINQNPHNMGSGSGLNADLLDGFNSTLFCQTDGTVSRIIAVTGAQPTNATGLNNDYIVWY